MRTPHARAPFRGENKKTLHARARFGEKMRVRYTRDLVFKGKCEDAPCCTFDCWLDSHQRQKTQTPCPTGTRSCLDGGPGGTNGKQGDRMTGLLRGNFRESRRPYTEDVLPTGHCGRGSNGKGLVVATVFSKVASLC